jgi:LacI family transcriptional regulator
MASRGGVTIQDVALLAGVAVSSVSRALSNHPDVSGAMKARVNAAAKELGYSPDPAAQSLRSGASRTVGFMVRDYANPYFSDIILGLEDTLTHAGYTLVVMNSGGEAASEVERIGLLAQRRVDALVLSSISDVAAAARAAVKLFRRPLVLLDRDFGQVRGAAVQLDHATGVHDATTDLIDLGHKRIAMVTGSTSIRPTRERLRGYREALEERGLPKPRALEVTGLFSDDFAHEATDHFLSLPVSRRPTAIIAGGVQPTLGVLKSLSAHGVQPGDDMSLVVCDDVPWLSVLRPTISVVSRDGKGIGKAAAELVLEQIAGKQPRIVTLPTAYEPRETSRKPASAS